MRSVSLRKERIKIVAELATPIDERGNIVLRKIVADGLLVRHVLGELLPEPHPHSVQDDDEDVEERLIEFSSASCPLLSPWQSCCETQTVSLFKMQEQGKQLCGMAAG